MPASKKCVVWDLDNTLWNGVCIEGPVEVRPDVVRAVTELDRRGILHSIASRGDKKLAMRTLKRFGLAEYFLIPQINWLPKAQNISRISRELGLPTDTIVFVDDDAFEREQVSFMLPDVLTIPANQAATLPHHAEFTPDGLTVEAQSRRQFYQAEIHRHRAESTFSSREEFLASCAMKLSVRPMRESEIPRVRELMTRTHQLNTTGLIVEQDQLHDLLSVGDDRPRVFVAELWDRFGSYGIIGTALVDHSPERWILKYFALSCRVLGRGIERAFLSRLVHTEFNTHPTVFEAEFRDTGRNKMMRAMYQMMGFHPVGKPDDEGRKLFCANRNDVPLEPSWIEVV